MINTTRINMQFLKSSISIDLVFPKLDGFYENQKYFRKINVTIIMNGIISFTMEQIYIGNFVSL